jgi:tripartite-type tricarboxylate transporter receptor subunit TctC
MKKKMLALLLSAAMAFSLTACGPGETNSPPPQESKAAAESQPPAESKAPENVTADAFKPSKDFNMRVPFAAGGSADTIARIIAQGLQKTYGKSAVVNNLTGANGAVAAADLDGTAPDATELMVGGIAMFTLAPLFNPDVTMKLEDYQFVCNLVSDNQILFVAPGNSGLNSWEDLQEYAKSNRLLFASQAPGDASHMLLTMLFGQAGIDAEAVTTDGGAKSLLSLAGGNVACAIATSTVGAQYVEEGTLVPVLVFSDEPFTRYDGFEVPTAKSLGYDIVFQTCNFLMTRKDANPDDVAAIYQAILDYSETEEFKELAANASYVPDLADGETIRQIIADTASMCQSAYETYYAK